MNSGSGGSCAPGPSGGAEVGDPAIPQLTLEQMSIQAEMMDRNKESLQRKLLYRRSVNELKNQGIYPTQPPAFAEQTRNLQRAQTQDRLKSKIQNRPDRQSLVQQHILEDSKADAGLLQRQLQLIKARRADELNDKIAHRPGPLELVAGNILRVKELISLEGVAFVKTEDGADPVIQKLPYEVESPPKSGQSSPDPLEESVGSTAGPPSTAGPQPGASLSFGVPRIPSPPDITPLLVHPTHSAPYASITVSVGEGGKITTVAPSSVPAGSVVTTLVPAHTIVSPGSSFSLSRPTPRYVHQLSGGSGSSIVGLVGPSGTMMSGGGSSSGGGCSAAASGGLAGRINKKSKLKTVNKPKVIKFHEYKGPPPSKGASGKGGNIIESGPCNSTMMVSGGGNGGLSGANVLPANVTMTPGAISVPLTALQGANAGASRDDGANGVEEKDRYHIMLQQQQLFLQMQLEFQKNDLPVPVLVPVQSAAAAAALAQQQQQQQQQHHQQQQQQAKMQSTKHQQLLQSQVVRPPSVVPTPSPAPSVMDQILYSPGQPQSVPPPTPQPAQHLKQQPKQGQAAKHSQKQGPKTAQSQQQQKTHVKVEASKSWDCLQDLKVAELKAKLKQLSLPVSGAKPQLIDRLRTHLGTSHDLNISSVKSTISDSSAVYSNVSSVQSNASFEDHVSAPPSILSQPPLSVAPLSVPPPSVAPPSVAPPSVPPPSAGSTSVGGSSYVGGGSIISGGDLSVDITTGPLSVSSSLQSQHSISAAMDIDEMSQQGFSLMSPTRSNPLSPSDIMMQQRQTDIVERQARRIEDLQRALQESERKRLQQQPQQSRQQPQQSQQQQGIGGSLANNLQQQTLAQQQQQGMSIQLQQQQQQLQQQLLEQEHQQLLIAQSGLNSVSGLGSPEEQQFTQPLPVSGKTALSHQNSAQNQQRMRRAAEAMRQGHSNQSTVSSSSTTDQEHMFSMSASSSVLASSSDSGNSDMFYQSVDGTVLKVIEGGSRGEVSMTMCTDAEVAASMSQRLPDKVMSLPSSPSSKDKRSNMFSYPSVPSDPLADLDFLRSDDGTSDISIKGLLGERTWNGMESSGQNDGNISLEGLTSERVDEVLAVLIRAGELPPNAVEEALPPPKTQHMQASNILSKQRQPQGVQSQHVSKMVNSEGGSTGNNAAQQQPIGHSFEHLLLNNSVHAQQQQRQQQQQLGGLTVHTSSSSSQSQHLVNGIDSNHQSQFSNLLSPYNLSPNDMVTDELNSPLGGLDSFSQPYPTFEGMDWSEETSTGVGISGSSSAGLSESHRQASTTSQSTHSVSVTEAGTIGSGGSYLGMQHHQSHNGVLIGGSSVGNREIGGGLVGGLGMPNTMSETLDWLDIELPGSSPLHNGCITNSGFGVSAVTDSYLNTDGSNRGIGGQGGIDFTNDPILTPKTPPQDDINIFSMPDFNLSADISTGLLWD